jgi:predicted Rossmann fold flavoprotein
VVARSGKTSFREAALFTHRGLSGPAILQISTYWRHGQEIEIDFLPGSEPGWLREAKQSSPRITVPTALSRRLPERLADALLERLYGGPGDRHLIVTELANLPNRSLEDMELSLAHWRFRPNGTEGFAKAEVTAGGIATEGLSSQTMEAKTVTGLYAIGEAVDVTGWLGGYNFQWAWASGWAAGQAI